MRRTLTIAVVLAAAALLTGCGSTADGPPWSDYAPELRAQLDALAAAKDCTALQAQFDTADANNEATMSRTGHNNAALMGYIDDLMRDAGCYG